eukprot:TRINITY_DN4234_c0_g2_i1.p1 TRINITY_DN4234_c0_g2~~TRINITY_DN4234_c0_g2_i1.p1  ORF type:complete len:219 (-),score=56.94 TRINITY_DN4234_c0_g2_i1:25-681(-)
MAILITPSRIYFANAGDSRVVLASKNGSICQVTLDHKPDAPSEKERVEKTGGFVTESKRVNGVLALSRALGDVEFQPAITHVPDLFQHTMSDEYELMIVACDGLWDVVSNQEAVKIASEEPSPSKAAVRLRDLAYILGSTDNISIIIVKFSHAHSIRTSPSDISQTQSGSHIITDNPNVSALNTTTETDVTESDDHSVNQKRDATNGRQLQKKRSFST